MNAMLGTLCIGFLSLFSLKASYDAFMNLYPNIVFY